MNTAYLSKRLNYDSLLYFVGRLLPALLSFFSIAVFVQLLGEKTYGEYTLIMSVSLVIGNICGSWLTQAILRYQSDFLAKKTSKKFIYTINLCLIQSLFYSAILMVLVAYINFRTIEKVILSVLIVTSQIVYMVFFSQQQALMNTRKILVIETLRSIATCTIPIILILSTDNKNYFLLLFGAIIGNLIGCIMAYPKFVNKIMDIQKYHSSMLSGYLWSYGWPMALWIGSATALNVIDRYIISWLVDVQSVGTYSAIYDVIYKSFNLLLTPILLAVHPMIMKEWNQGNKIGAKKLIERSILLQLSLSFIFIICFLGSAKWIVHFVIGRDDEVATMLVLPIALGATMWQLSMLLHKPLELEKRTKLMLIYVLIALLINILLNILLIPLFGYVAAAYTTLISTALYGGLVVTTFLVKSGLFKRKLTIFIKRKLTIFSK